MRNKPVKIRTSLIVVAWLLCVGSVSAVFLQRSELNGLRSHEERVAPPLEADSDSAGSDLAPASGPEGTSRELLQLRAEVTRLTSRKRELAGVEKASEQLRAQLATPPAGSGMPLPRGYIRKANARWLGCSTPENTVQSWLWALQHHDFTRMLETLSPGDAQRAQARMGVKGDNDAFFKQMDVLPGFAIQGRKNLPDGSVELEIYLTPGMPAQHVELQTIHGQWKMAEW